jgi:glycerophosphoryl diester phosphodiesterase
VAKALHPPRSSPYLSPAPPRVLAHRGLAIDAPENTLLAFLKALAVGVTHIETDVRASRDGVSVISHDRGLSRLTGRHVNVADLTVAELQDIDLGFGQTYCTLAEALDAFPDARFNIDIKSPDAVAPTVEAILEAGAIRRVLVTSFSERRRAAAVRSLPGVATSASGRLFLYSLFAAKASLTPLVRAGLRRVDAIQVPERALRVKVTTERMLRRFHAAGVEVHVWTINDPADMRRLLALGVDGIVTDRADLAMDIVRANT